MSTELQNRAAAFLRRDVPKGIPYVPDSIAEQLIATYARRGRITDDAETAELMELAAMESNAMADELKDPAAAAYFRESSALLEAMLAECI